MSLSQEWIEQRDQFVTDQKEQGSFTLDETLEKLELSLADLYDLGIVIRRDTVTSGVNSNQLTALGGVFFIEQYQQIFITQDGLHKLKQALENWDRIAIDYPISESALTGLLCIHNQTRVDFKLHTKQFRHQIKLHIDLNSHDVKGAPSDNKSTQLTNAWHDLSQCVTLLESYSDAVLRLVADVDSGALAINQAWHPAVKKYFHSRIYQFSFEPKMSQLKASIESTYSLQDSVWQPLVPLFQNVKPNRQASESMGNSDDEVKVNIVRINSIDKYGLIAPQNIEASLRKPAHVQRLKAVQPGDVLLTRKPNNKQVTVAYYPEEHNDTVFCADHFVLLRAQSDENWDGKKLFLLLSSQAGKALLDHCLHDESLNAVAAMRITPRQINTIELPELSNQMLMRLDKQYQTLEKLLIEKTSIEQQISELLHQH